MTWNDVARIVNEELGENNTSDKYRKEFTRKFKDVLATREEELDAQEDLYAKVAEQLVQIRKEKTVVKDLRNDANAQLRAFDRLEYMKQIAIDCANDIKDSLLQYRFKPITVIPGSEGDRQGLLLLGDWHFGIEVDSFWNVYNPEICKERLQDLLEQVVAVANENKIKTIHVFNLGDLISGRIHAQLRMQSRIDAVDQTMKVGTLLEMFILQLRKADFKIEYYDCLDNHSRVEPDKKESLQLESFAKFIHWHLETVFNDVPDVTVHDNVFGDDIIYAEILGNKVVGVHGDKDDPKKVVKDISSLMGIRPDLICTAHRHHFAADETTRCPVLCNPSLMGQDQYALDGRLDSSPAQLFVVLKEDNPLYCQYRLIVG